MIFDAASSNNQSNLEATPFDLLEHGAPSIDVDPSHLLRMGAELLAAGLPATGWGEALLLLPKGISDEFRRRFDLDESGRVGELRLISLTDGGARVSVRSLGKLSRNHPLRRVLTLLIVREDYCAVLCAKSTANGDGTEKAWKSVLSAAVTDVLDSANHIARTISESLPEAGNIVESLIQKIDRCKSNHNPIRHSRMIGPIAAALSSGCDKRTQSNDHDLRWFKTITKIQDAIGWELDSQKLNLAVARVLKESVGYDYMELQWFQNTGKECIATGAFQRNDTSFGGPLLTVILKPDMQTEILRAHKPLLIKSDSGADVLMNPRLLTLMGLQSGILVPLIFQRRPNGLLKLFSCQSGYFGLDDIDRMEAIGRVIAKSIENARTHSTMRRMATVDGLTNVYNHRFFSEQITREFKRARRYESSLTLLMIDIDHFKIYNDTFGHLQGDRILTAVAEIIKSNVREVDLVCRYGGEEFTVILPETDISQGQVVAEKIRKVAEEYRIHHGARPSSNKVTVSIGIALLTPEVEGPTEFVNRADIALYRAKKLGRNRCEAY